MTAAVVAPLVPPRNPVGGVSRGRDSDDRRVPAGFRRVPLAPLSPARDRCSVYGFAVVNDRGRIAAQPIVQALGWQPGTPLTIRDTAGLILIAADPDGTSRVTGDGHLRISAVVRHWCGLTPHSRVLLVAEPVEGRLVVHPAASLDAMVTRAHAAIFGGEPA